MSAFDDIFDNSISKDELYRYHIKHHIGFQTGNLSDQEWYEAINLICTGEPENIDIGFMTILSNYGTISEILFRIAVIMYNNIISEMIDRVNEQRTNKFGRKTRIKLTDSFAILDSDNKKQRISFEAGSSQVGNSSYYTYLSVIITDPNFENEQKVIDRVITTRNAKAEIKTFIFKLLNSATEQTLSDSIEIKKPAYYYIFNIIFQKYIKDE